MNNKYNREELDKLRPWIVNMINKKAKKGLFSKQKNGKFKFDKNNNGYAMVMVNYLELFIVYSIFNHK